MEGRPANCPAAESNSQILAVCARSIYCCQQDLHLDGGSLSTDIDSALILRNHHVFDLVLCVQTGCHSNAMNKAAWC